MEKDKILKKIQENFESVGVSCDLYEEGEITPGAVLSCKHKALGFFGENGIGQYFFLDLGNAAENTEYLLCMITLDDELDDADLAELSSAICILNYYMPYGAFVLSPDNDLSYKSTAILSSDMEQEAAEKDVDRIVAHTLDAFRRYIGLLMSVIKGEIKAEEITEIMDRSGEE